VRSIIFSLLNNFSELSERAKVGGALLYYIISRYFYSYYINPIARFFHWPNTANDRTAAISISSFAGAIKNKRGERETHKLLTLMATSNSSSYIIYLFIFCGHRWIACALLLLMMMMMMSVNSTSAPPPEKITSHTIIILVGQKTFSSFL